MTGICPFHGACGYCRHGESFLFHRACYLPAEIFWDHDGIIGRIKEEKKLDDHAIAELKAEAVTPEYRRDMDAFIRYFLGGAIKETARQVFGLPD